IFIGTAARGPVQKTSYYFGLPLVRTLVDLRKGRLELDAGLLAREREVAPRVARFLALRYVVVEHAFADRGVVDFLEQVLPVARVDDDGERDRKSTRLNSSHQIISYAVFCLKKKNAQFAFYLYICDLSECLGEF